MTIAARGLLLRWAAALIAAIMLSAAALAADDAPTAPAPAISATALGISFVDGSASRFVIERDGKQYEVDLATKSVREVAPAVQDSSSTQPAAPQNAAARSQEAEENERGVPYYRPADDLLFDLPTGRPLDRHSWTVNFTHRFPNAPAFTGVARGNYLLGLDDFGIPSFGMQFGITDRLSVSAFRSPSALGRPIELGARFDLMRERKHAPFNAAFRFSVDGQDDFQRDYTTNFELITSRSLGSRAQVYVTPTGSIHNRPTVAAPSALILGTPPQPCSLPLANRVPAAMRVKPCADTFSVGVGLAVDVRHTVTLFAESIPTLVNGTDLGIHRAPFSFGIQKKIWHHGFTFGLSNSPGTIVSQRIATSAVYLRNPHGDTPDKIFIGFNIMRQF